VPLADDALDFLLQRPVAVPRDVGDVLEEVPGLDAALELVVGEKRVLAAVGLARPALARGGRDGHGQIGAAADERPDQRALAGAGRPGDDEEPGPHG
jgi:hypothetical protein